MRRHAILSAAVAGATVLAVAAPAAAINTYNSAPAPERTEVGAFVALWDTDDDAVVDRLDWVCSGAMVDDDTFLTAAHCTDDWPEGTRFFVSLEQDIQTPLDDAVAAGLTASEAADELLDERVIVEADAHQDPAYPGPESDAHDIGVLDFATRTVTPADVWSFTPATLPTAGQLDAMGRAARSTSSWLAVGYGTEEALRGPGGHTHPGGGTRRKAAEGFTALNKAWVRLDMHQSHDFGGACYGDSGGPNFVTIGGQFGAGGDDHHRRHALLRDERRLPDRYPGRPRVPRDVRRPPLIAPRRLSRSSSRRACRRRRRSSAR